MLVSSGRVRALDMKVDSMVTQLGDGPQQCAQRRTSHHGADAGDRDGHERERGCRQRRSVSPRTRVLMRRTCTCNRERVQPRTCSAVQQHAYMLIQAEAAPASSKQSTKERGARTAHERDEAGSEVDLIRMVERGRLDAKARDLHERRDPAHYERRRHEVLLHAISVLLHTQTVALDHVHEAWRMRSSHKFARAQCGCRASRRVAA